MLTVFLDKNIKMPLYQQLYETIKKDIRNNKIKANEKLPSKRALAKNLEISLVTVEGAYNQLIVEGYVYSIIKKGYFVENIEHHIIEKPLIFNSSEKIIEYEYDFKTNYIDENNFPVNIWAKLTKEVLLSDKHLLNKSHRNGVLMLREEIVKYVYEYRKITANPKQIIIASGFEALSSILVTLLGNEKTYGVETPGYQKISSLYKNNNVNLVKIPLDSKGVQVNRLDNVNIIHVSPSHQFPTGIIMPISRRIDLIKWSRKKEDNYIIEDDYDSEFRFSGQPIPAMQNLDRNKVIYINSFTKTISPTIRISFMILPLNLIDEYNRKYNFFTCGVSAITQAVLAKFMKEGHYEKHLNKMRKIYKAKKEYLISELQKQTWYDNFDIVGDQAGLHFILKTNSRSQFELVEKAKKQGIRMYSINEFYNDKKERNEIVLGYSNLSVNDIDCIIKKLSLAWDS